MSQSLEVVFSEWSQLSVRSKVRKVRSEERERELFIYMFRTTIGTTDAKHWYYRPSDLNVGKSPTVIKEVRKIGLPVLPSLSRYYRPASVLSAKGWYYRQVNSVHLTACANLACRYYRRMSVLPARLRYHL